MEIEKKNQTDRNTLIERYLAGRAKDLNFKISITATNSGIKIGDPVHHIRIWILIENPEDSKLKDPTLRNVAKFRIETEHSLNLVIACQMENNPPLPPTVKPENVPCKFAVIAKRDNLAIAYPEKDEWYEGTLSDLDIALFQSLQQIILKK